MGSFYLQDSRSYVGNDVLWWAKGFNGYTTDLRNAHVFTLAEAQQHHDSRNSDIPWPCDYIEARTRPAVDMQHIKRDEALRDSGVTLCVEKKPSPARLRCQACNSFISAANFWGGECTRCGADSRP
jgi:hypothetical protein